jgi:hypothetical protein
MSTISLLPLLPLSKHELGEVLSFLLREVFDGRRISDITKSSIMNVWRKREQLNIILNGGVEF